MDVVTPTLLRSMAKAHYERWQDHLYPVSIEKRQSFDELPNDEAMMWQDCMAVALPMLLRIKPEGTVK